MMKILKTLLLLFFSCSSLFAQSLVGVWVEANLDGYTTPSIKYAFTHDLLKLRDMKAREQTIYPYVCRNGYIYLSPPTQITKTNLVLSKKVFKYEIFEKHFMQYLKLQTDNDEFLLVSEGSVKNLWNKTADIFKIIGAAFIADGINDLSDIKSTDYKKEKFQKKTVYKNDKIFDPNLKDERGRTNLERMKKGLAPIGFDGKSIQLHHADQNEKGPLYEVSDSLHHGHFSELHKNTGQYSSEVNHGAEWDKFRTEYWKNRAKDFER